MDGEQGRIGLYILGINAYHAGASACLIQDGELVAAAEEERFTREKYWAGFPVHAIKYCLREGGISPHELDHIGISRNPGANLHKKVLRALRSRPNFNFIKDRLDNMARVRDPGKAFCQALEVNRSDLKAQFHSVEHHRAHMASAFFVSEFDEAAVLSVDGMGDFVSTMWGVGRGNHLDVLGTIDFPHSLGIFYSALTQWLGFTKYGDEGKVMGLASYGQPIYLDRMHEIVRLQQDGTFELDLDYFIHHAEGVDMSWEHGAPELGTLYSEKLIGLFGPPRRPHDEITTDHQNVAASLQAMLEEAEFGLVRMLEGSTETRALCMAGGVALNSTFNGKILPSTAFEDIFIQPAASDAGTALGAAYYIYHQVLGNPRRYVMDNAYTGPSFTDGVISDVLADYQLEYSSHSNLELTRIAAEEVANGKVLGWFQGRMEWGPRALGNRSIIADPRRNDMRGILNARVKHREDFRPFAPSVLLESVGDYFDQSYPDPFMLKIYNFLPEKREEVPAVTHVDGTGRLQTVDEGTAPQYWRLIKEFSELTGVPMVLNTSFNENEPIVCTPREAVECFLRTKMEVLVIGNHLVRRD